MRCRGCAREVGPASGERIGFSEACPACATDLHSCLHCAHHDPSAYNECRESSAERVAERGRANRCEYFRPGESGDGPDPRTPEQTLAVLRSLFKKAGAPK